MAHLLFSSKRLPAFEVLRSPSDRRVAEYVVLKNGLRVLLVSDPTRAGALGVFLFGTAFGCAAFGVVSRLQVWAFVAVSCGKVLAPIQFTPVAAFANVCQ